MTALVMSITASWQAAPPGRAASSALRLDGLDDHVWISDSTSLQVSGTLTLQAWVYPESTAGEQVLFSRWQDGQRAYELTLDQGRLRARLSGDGVNVADLGAAMLPALFQGEQDTPRAAKPLARFG